MLKINTAANRLRFTKGCCFLTHGSDNYDHRALNKVLRSVGRAMAEEGLREIQEAREEAVKEEVEQARLEKVLKVSGGKWRLEVSTQVYENYGSRWKAKGGSEYQVRFDTRPTEEQFEVALADLTKKVTHKGSDDQLHSYDEWVIDAQLYSPHEETPAEAEVRQWHMDGYMSDKECSSRLTSLTARTS